MKLIERKDRPKKVNGSWAFLLEFPVGLRKMTMTMLEMTKPIHSSGKVVVGNSGLCVWEGVIECHKHGIWFQAYIKIRRNLPWGVQGEVINGYFDKATFGHCKTLVAEHDNIEFRVHCCQDDKYVSKIMSTHGMVETVQDHPTYWKDDGEWKSFKHMEPFSCYCSVKHLVDDVNNCHHDPIGLEEVWGMMW